MMEVKLLRKLPNFVISLPQEFIGGEKDDICHYPEQIAVLLIKQGIAEDTGKILIIPKEKIGKLEE